MSKELNPDNSPLPQLNSEPKHPVSMALPVDLQSAITILVADFSYTSFGSVKTAYRNALLASIGPQCLELVQSTIDNYLELTAGLYKKYNELAVNFTHTSCVYLLTEPIRDAMLDSMTTCGAVYFARLLLDCLQGRKEVEYALRAALKEGRALYLMWFYTVAVDFPELAQTVVDAVWNVRHDHLHLLMRHCACCKWLCTEMMKCYMTKTLSETSSWMEPDPEYDLSPLTTCILWHFVGFQHADVCLKLTWRQTDLLPDFVNFCIDLRASVVAIFMAALAEDWPLVRTVLRLRPEELQRPTFPLSKFLLFMARRAPLEIVVESALAVIDESAVSTLKFDPQVLDTQYVITMSNMCLSSGRPKWAIFFRLHTKARVHILDWIASINDSDTVDMVLVNIARYSRWNVVDRLLPLSSKDATVMSYVFQRAAVKCKVDVVERLLPHVDLGLLPFVHGDEEGPLAIFRTPVDFAEHRDTISKVRIVLLLVKQGLASHVRHGEKVVEDTIKQGMPTVARLLLDVGMVAKNQFKKALQNVRERNYVGFPPELRKAVDRMIQDDSLDRPRTLRDSRRIKLSHKVGFGSSRTEKIEQLPLPRKLKDLVALTDLIEPVEALVGKVRNDTVCF